MQINKLDNSNFSGIYSAKNLKDLTVKDETPLENKICKNYTASNVKANFAPQINFTGNASKIKNAYIITGEENDVPLLMSKDRGSYIIDFDSQTEIIYGDNAKNFLNKTTSFDYDTQIIIPKNSSGILKTEDGKTIELPENTGVLLNAGTKANVKIKNGYPMVLMSKKDYDWYERYGKDAETESIRDKYAELVHYNSHLYSGEFSPNSFLSDEIADQDFLESIGINKWNSQNHLVYDIYGKKDLLSDDKKEEIIFVKNFVDKLHKTGVVRIKEDGYLKFKNTYNFDYQKKKLLEKGFSEDELKLLQPVYNRARQARLDAIASIKNSAFAYGEETVQKMKEKGFFYDTKNNDGNVYWKKLYANEKTLREDLANNGFSTAEQKEILEAWRKENRSGFDMTGLKFINKDLAVYGLGDKLNNWTHEKTHWISNSTAMKSDDGTSPFLGVSIVQTGKTRPVKMSELRKGEKLHSHPNLGERRQTEIYVVTSGAAALNVVKNGISNVQILKEGDLAVVGPGVLHCVNSVLGEYEHIVAQVPSAFQYGFDFKQIVEPPEDYDEKWLDAVAKFELENYREYESSKDSRFKNIIFNPIHKALEKIHK